MASIPALPTAKLRIEDNASPGAGEGPFQIRRVSDNQIFKFTSTTISGVVFPLDEFTCLPDAIKRLESFSDGVSELVVEIATVARDFELLRIGGDVDQKPSAWWGSLADPTVPIQNVTITRASGVLSKPVINGVEITRFCKNTANQDLYIQGLIDLKLQDVELFCPDSRNFCFRTFLGNAQRFGKFSLFNVDFDGTEKGSGRAVQFNCRLAYCSWDLRNCDFTSALEYYLYTDAPQADSQMLDCTDLNAQTFTNPGNGRGAVQLTQRASINGTNAQGQGYEGGPPAVGTVTYDGNNFTNNTVNYPDGACAFNLVGHVGTVNVTNNTLQQCYGGAVQCWTNPDHGIHTTDGASYDTPPVSLGGAGDPVPCSGTAWTFGTVNVSGNEYYEAAGVNSRPVYGFEGVENLNIGLNTEPLGVSNVRYWFYIFFNSGDGDPVDGPLDNKNVSFLSATWGSPISNTLSKGAVRYGGTGNPSMPGANAPNAELLNSEIDALEDTNSAYPPWTQNLGSGAKQAWQPGFCVNPGFALQDPASITITAVDPVSVDLIGGPGEVIANADPAVIRVSAIDPDLIQNGIISPADPATITVSAADITVGIEVAGDETAFPEPASITVTAVDPANVLASAPASSVGDDPNATPIVERLETGTIVRRRSTF